MDEVIQLSHTKLNKKLDRIHDAISSGNLRLAQIMLDEVKITNPDDKLVRCMQSRLYTFHRKYKDAYDVLIGVDEDYCFRRKTSLCIKLGLEDEVYRLYEKYFSDSKILENFDDNKDYYWLYCYLNAKYNPRFNTYNYELSYMGRQMAKYSRKDALRHIVRRHCPIVGEDNHDKFSYEICVDELYNKCRKLISNNLDNATLVNTYIDSYLIEYPNSSVSSAGYDYINVICLLNTDKIITMYPSKKLENMPVLKFSEIDKRKENGKTLVKTRSGLERFNERYKKRNS